MTFLLGILIGAMLPVVFALTDQWLHRRRQRRLARDYLRRSIP